jgi:hypothetical protein
MFFYFFIFIFFYILLFLSMNLGAHMFAETEMTLETGLEAGSCTHSIEFILRAESWQLSRLAGITG